MKGSPMAFLENKISLHNFSENEQEYQSSSNDLVKEEDELLVASHIVDQVLDEPFHKGYTLNDKCRDKK